jgi:4-hydroxyproline epimerase
VTVANVASYRHAHHVALTLPDGHTIHGDVAWGGNWFFLCHDHGYDLHHDSIATLTQAANTIRQALVSHGITGADNTEIDHIECIPSLLPPALIAGASCFAQAKPTTAHPVVPARAPN